MNEKSTQMIPVATPPKPQFLEQRIRVLSEDTQNIVWTDHANARMIERDISVVRALKVLRTGYLEGEIIEGERSGEWACKMVAKIKGNRDVGVATLVVHNRRLIIKTVEWEDLT